MPTNKGQKSPKRPLIFYYAVTLIVLMLLNWLFFPSLLSRQVTEVGYDELVSMVDDGKVETVSYDSQDHEIVFEAKDDKGKTALYKTGIFPDDALVDRLLRATSSSPPRSLRRLRRSSACSSAISCRSCSLSPSASGSRRK